MCSHRDLHLPELSQDVESHRLPVPLFHRHFYVLFAITNERKKKMNERRDVTLSYHMQTSPPTILCFTTSAINRFVRSLACGFHLWCTKKRTRCTAKAFYSAGHSYHRICSRQPKKNDLGDLHIGELQSSPLSRPSPFPRRFSHATAVQFIFLTGSEFGGPVCLHKH